MDTQMILKPSDKVVVIADYREKEMIENLKMLGATVNEMNLKIGDFACSNNLVIERKSHSDFVSSIIDGRIFDQIRHLKENYERPVVIVEGFSNREINENALKATIASIIAKHNISVISTRNTLDTARMVYWLAKKNQEDANQLLGFKQGKKPKDMRSLQEFMISSIPGISSTLSKRLLEKFGTIEKIISSAEEELSQVKGIGKKHANKIKKLLTRDYNDG